MLFLLGFLLNDLFSHLLHAYVAVYIILSNRTGCSSHWNASLLHCAIIPIPFHLGSSLPFLCIFNQIPIL
jgi:hypothetical protein